MKQAQVLERNNLLVEELRKHRGCDDCITSKQVSEFLASRGYSIKARNVGTLINKLMMERCLPICYINGKGYYWATKRSEIETTISDLQSRVYALQEHIEHLKSFIVE